MLQVRPAWGAYARSDSSAVAGGAVVIDLPNPQPGRPGLQIETDGDWITVCFDRMHANFHVFTQPDHEAWAEALAFVDAIVDERVAVAVTRSGPTGAEWRVIGPGEAPPSPPAGSWVYVVSWLGSFDQVDVSAQSADPGTAAAWPRE